jgi:hypothetical protein
MNLENFIQIENKVALNTHTHTHTHTQSKIQKKKRNEVISKNHMNEPEKASSV